MRILALALALCIQLLSLSAWGDQDVQPLADTPCLNDLSTDDGDESTQLRRHPAGKACPLHPGIVFCEVPLVTCIPQPVVRTANAAVPAVLPSPSFPVLVLRC